MPPRCPRKLSAVRSASKIARVSPRTLMRTVPLATFAPSATNTEISVRPTSSRTARAMSMPAITPALRETKSATIFSLPETVATEVMSCPPSRSSASARLMSSRSIIGCLPPDNPLSSIQFDQVVAQYAFAIDYLILGNLHASENHVSLAESAPL